MPESYTANDDINVYLNANNGLLFWNFNLTNQVSTNYTIWDLSNNIDLITTELEPHSPTDLTQTATFGAPMLEWNHPQIANGYRTGYRIYRSIGSTSNFSLIGSTHRDSARYKDVGLILNGGDMLIIS